MTDQPDIVLPTKAEREYLVAFGVAAVFVAAGPTGRPCFIGTTRDLRRAEANLAEAREGVRIVSAWWTQPAIAERITETARSDLARVTPSAGGWFAEHAARIGEAVQRIGGAALTPHAATLARVEAAVAALSAKIDKAKAEGSLRFFNRAFTEYRLAATAAGEKPMAYADALARLRKALVGRLAQTGRSEIDAALLADVFPARMLRAAE